MFANEYGWMSEHTENVDRMIDQLLERKWPLPSRFRTASGEGQIVPINVFQNNDEVVVVAPMPGMEPDSIEVQLTRNTLTIRGHLRGPGQMDRDYIRHEWTYGPYYRTTEIPVPVDADQANASYDNGVLTITLPKSPSFKGHRIQLQQVGPAQGRTQGHAGHAIE